MKNSSKTLKSSEHIVGNVLLTWYFWLVTIIDIKTSLEVYSSLRMAAPYTELCVSQATNEFCFCALSLFREKWACQDVGDLRRGRKRNSCNRRISNNKQEGEHKLYSHLEPELVNLCPKCSPGEVRGETCARQEQSWLQIRGIYLKIP